MIKNHKVFIDENLILDLPYVKADDISYFSFNIMGMHRLNKDLAYRLYLKLKAKDILPQAIICVG